MGYRLKAFIGTKESLVPIISKYAYAILVDLNDEISMISVTDELFDEINQMVKSTKIAPFSFLSHNLESKVLKLIGNATLAYVESDFFGGHGGHAGLIWKNGIREFVRGIEHGTLNEILGKLGVIRSESQDEFKTVGLDRHRDTEDWIE